MNIFEEVKAHTDILTVAEHYGLTIRNVRHRGEQSALLDRLSALFAKNAA